jgi:hypothetical protein
MNRRFQWQELKGFHAKRQMPHPPRDVLRLSRDLSGATWRKAF